MREITLPSEIVVKASATTANLGLGLDVFGMALDQSKEGSLLEVKQ
jgi:homoserine kinase